MQIECKLVIFLHVFISISKKYHYIPKVNNRNYTWINIFRLSSKHARISSMKSSRTRTRASPRAQTAPFARELHHPSGEVTSRTIRPVPGSTRNHYADRKRPFYRWQCWRSHRSRRGALGAKRGGTRRKARINRKQRRVRGRGCAGSFTSFRATESHNVFIGPNRRKRDQFVSEKQPSRADHGDPGLPLVILSMDEGKGPTDCQ